MATRIRVDLIEYPELPDRGWLIETVEVPTRSRRRHHRQRMKAKAKRMVQALHWPDQNGRRLGRLYSTHCCPCSCNLCRSPEEPRHSEVKRIHSTNQEEA